jgi:antitoxin ChpS
MRTTLRKVGGSVMLAVPPAILDLLDLTAGSSVGIAIDNGRLVIEPQKKPKYTLRELLDQCDPNAPINETAREWLDAPPVGRELI